MAILLLIRPGDCRLDFVRQSPGKFFTLKSRAAASPIKRFITLDKCPSLESGFYTRHLLG
jgi:hypothetical protein